MARPAKKQGDKYKSLTISVRPEDVRALQLLALERHAAATVEVMEAAREASSFHAPERPSVSSAIRYLIDEERKRRLERARAAARRGELRHLDSSDQKNLTEAQLLGGDPVFGPGARSSEPAAVDALVPLKQTTKPKRR